MDVVLTLNRFDVGLMIAAFIGFILRYLFEMDLAKVVGVFMMAPATAWLSQATYEWAVPHLGWAGWGLMIVVGGMILSGIRGTSTVIISLIMASFALWLRIFTLYRDVIPVKFAADQPAIASAILVGVLFLIWGIFDFTRENAVFG